MALTTRIGGSRHRLIVEIAGADHPGSAFAVLRGRQDLLLYQAPNRCFAYLEDGCCFFQRGLATLGALAFAEGRDAAVVA